MKIWHNGNDWYAADDVERVGYHYRENNGMFDDDDPDWDPSHWYAMRPTEWLHIAYYPNEVPDFIKNNPTSFRRVDIEDRDDPDEPHTYVAQAMVWAYFADEGLLASVDNLP